MPLFDKLGALPNVYIEIAIDHFVCWERIFGRTPAAQPRLEKIKTMTAVYFGATDADKACDALVSDLLKV